MRKINLTLFALGLFSELHVRLIGSLGLSELFIFLIAPFIYIMDIRKLRRDNFMPYIFCCFLVMLGCVISSLYNKTPLPSAIRGFASAYSLFAIPVVLHRYLSRDLGGLKWFILGMALSGILSIFGLQSGVEVASGEVMEGGVEATELYFVRHFGGVISVWYRGWYMNCPTVLAVILMLLPSLQMIVFTGTGRSALLVTLLSILMLAYVRKRISRMRKLKKNILLIGTISLVVVVSAVQLYKFAAMKGLLNEGAQKKYEYQMRNGGGALSLIMRGRGDFFAGVMACCDRPIWGFGPWAVDDGRYWQRFLLKYGDSEDYEKFQAEQHFRGKFGLTSSLIPAHSHIIGFWLWYGILGVPIWLYVLKMMIEYLRRYIDAVPQWFVVLVCGAPGVGWNIFFSPFSSRMGVCLYITCLLLAIAVGKGRILLPYELQVEALEKDR